MQKSVSISPFRDALRKGSQIWFFGGIAALAIACGFAIHTSIWLYQSVPALGTITELTRPTANPKSTASYTPKFSFEAEDGRTYIVTSSVSTNPPEFQVGQTVHARYRRNDPASAKLDYFWQLWFVPVLLGGLGTFFTVVGFLLLRYLC